ncbi:MAG: hypothetical protein PHS60_13270 [Zavarzinia sp.]|nr:hypothetical protein [Zavarzinia sp.]
MEIKPSPAILSALASLQQGGTGSRVPNRSAGEAPAAPVQTAEAVPRVSSGVDIRVGGEERSRGTVPQREVPGTTTRPLQPGLGRLIDLSV